MKKLRMIVTSVIVLAIVGSAFAFKVKAGAFCILNSATNGDDCTTYITARKTTTAGLTSYKYAPCWDFDTTACTASNNNLCTSGTLGLTPLKFEAD